MERQREQQRANHKAVLGRECPYCKINDSETNWSRQKDCAACQRQGDRVGRCQRNRCLQPLRRCDGVSLCVVCDVSEWWARGYQRTYLFSPTDDRERAVWRKPQTEAPDAREATPYEWRTQR